MKILLLGCNGQVGWELQRALAPLGELVACDFDFVPDRRADFSAPDSVGSLVDRIRPHVVVNAAAHTVVDKAESEIDLSRTINAVTPGVIADRARALGALVVHYSTDYVFDGSGDQARDELAVTGPLSVYGKTKLEGEERIRASGCRHLIFRTSWVYAARGHNFIKTMLRLAQERERMTVINDQFGAPTGAALLADITAVCLQQAQPLTGIYHLAAAGETTWHAYAEYVLQTAKQFKPDIEYKVKEVAAVPTSEFPTPAQRPLNSRLNCSKLQQALQCQLPDWQKGVDTMLSKIL